MVTSHTSLVSVPFRSQTRYQKLQMRPGTIPDLQIHKGKQRYSAPCSFPGIPRVSTLTVHSGVVPALELELLDGRAWRWETEGDSPRAGEGRLYGMSLV